MLPSSKVDLGTRRSVIRELFEYGLHRAKEIGAENVFDFSLGNPSVSPPACVDETIRTLLDTKDSVSLHGYTSGPGDVEVRQKVADYIRDTFSIDAAAADIYMTVGAAASLCICLSAILDQGEKVIAFAPYFPEYKVFVENAGGRFCTVLSREEDFQIDIPALKAALTPDTSIVMVNSPNNPSGVVLTEQSIRDLSAVLTEAEEKFGHPIYLLADEPYRELVYDGITVPYIPHYYKDTIVCYSFSKSLSLPGERIGYIYVPKQVADSGTVMAAVQGAGRALGYVCAPSLFQRVIASCLGCTSDLEVYAANRALFYRSLTSYGFSVVPPDGAFYMFVRSPEPDANAFSERAKKYELLIVPGDDFGMPGYVRISYCVDPEKVRRSLPAFEKLAKDYGLTGKNDG